MPRRQGSSAARSRTRPRHPASRSIRSRQAVERIAPASRPPRALPFAFTLTARAENYLHGRSDLDDTIERLQAYDKAGADVLYAPGLRDIDDIRTVCAAVSKPVNVLALAGAPSVELLSAAGVRRISLGSGFFNTALGAFLRAAKDVREHGTFGCLDGAATSRDLRPFMEERGTSFGGLAAGVAAGGTRRARPPRSCAWSARRGTAPRTSPTSAARRRSRGRRRP